MKLNLVVASGVHEGKAIPINVPQFVIGRDPQCQLRPASPSISKRHCAITVRGQQVFIRDFGSTNGTFVNDQLIQDEVELKHDDRLKVGPLDFKVGLEVTTVSAPKPAAALAATGTASPAVAKKPAPAPVAQGDDTVTLDAPPSAGPTSDNIADLLLDDDGSTPAPQLDSPESVPEGSTIMELPAADKSGQPAKPKSVMGTGNTSAAAAEILKKYQRRPRS
ncbi:MAG: FHA domain-containing protein [Gemmataceae bacterium]